MQEPVLLQRVFMGVFLIFAATLMSAFLSWIEDVDMEMTTSLGARIAKSKAKTQDRLELNQSFLFPLATCMQTVSESLDELEEHIFDSLELRTGVIIRSSPRHVSCKQSGHCLFERRVVLFPRANLELPGVREHYVS